MIDPAGIRAQAERWWPQVLRAALTGAPIFPRYLTRIGKVKPRERLRDFQRVRAAQDALIAQSKEQTGSGYVLEWMERDYRDIGRNRFIDAIRVPTLDDYLAIVRGRAAYDRFLKDAALIRRQAPELADWRPEHPLEIEKYHGRWPDLLRLVRYFLDAHEPGRYYIRELPVEVPTKFVESHQGILDSLLAAALPEDRVRTGKTFEQRYGLKTRQPLVRLRLLDPDLGRTYFSGLTDLAIPLSDFESLNLPLRRLIVLENKTNYTNLMNFLTLPQCTGTAALFGSGFRVGLLRQARWLQKVELLYWGDIDAHGLQILSQLRGYFPHVRALLMDRDTFDALAEYHVDAPESNVVRLSHLTAAEQALFDHLNARRLRLEQERVPQRMVRAAFRRLL